MANLVITSTASSVLFDIGIYAALPALNGLQKSMWNKRYFSLRLYPTFVQVNILGNASWAMSNITEPNSYKVDSVDGVTPTSLSDLYDKLVTVLATI